MKVNHSVNEMPLALEREGIKTYVWEIFGAQILIEVFDDGKILVNGDPVVPVQNSEHYRFDKTISAKKALD